MRALQKLAAPVMAIGTTDNTQVHNVHPQSDSRAFRAESCRSSVTFLCYARTGEAFLCQLSLNKPFKTLLSDYELDSALCNGRSPSMPSFLACWLSLSLPNPARSYPVILPSGSIIPFRLVFYVKKTCRKNLAPIRPIGHVGAACTT